MFAKRTRNNRSDEEWFKIIEEWKLSQKGITIWCKEKGISDSSLRSAYKRLFQEQSSSFNKSCEKPLERSSFHELKQAKLAEKIEISFKGLTIKFDPDLNLLQNILTLLEGDLK